MRRLHLLKVILLLLIASPTLSQHLGAEKSSGAVGIGIGLPYGGIGGRISYNPLTNTTLFLGLGYNLAGLGINVGMQYLVPSSKQSQVYFSAMYGTNASIKVKGLDEATKSYYGPSFGIGVRINSLRSEGSYWDVGLVVPVRPSSFNDDMDALENNSSVTEISKPWPVLITAGYNFSLTKRKS